MDNQPGRGRCRNLDRIGIEKGQQPDIVVYELPPVVITQLGPPPAGHSYVRVDSDILLLAIGTGRLSMPCRV